MFHLSRFESNILENQSIYSPSEPSVNSYLTPQTENENAETLYYNFQGPSEEILISNSSSPTELKGKPTGSPPSESKSMLECSLCDLSFVHRSVLYHHYAMKHFKARGLN